LRFVFVVTFRNCERFLARCADSLLLQGHRDWIAYFRDDASSEAVSSLPKDPRIIYQRREERGGGLLNFHEALMENELVPSDVVCWVDGDDYLVGRDALDTVRLLYERTGCLLSYGQYETCQSRSGHCRAYTRDEFKRLRSCGFLASHLKTFRYSLYMEAMRQDPLCDRYLDADGRFFDMANDVSAMTPLLEVAGFERVAFNPVVVYHYTIHDGNEHSIDALRQKECVMKVMAKKPLVQADMT